MIEGLQRVHSPVGLRILKTTAAVTLSLVAVEQYGASAAKMIFSVTGAISAMEPAFKGALRNCVAQITSVIVGVLLTVAMLRLDVHGAIAVGIGIILIMAMHQRFHWRLSPVLPSLILVSICTDGSIDAIS